ncbi:hypothetical protein WJX77_000058 [Trebouxia sp. C0004]
MLRQHLEFKVLQAEKRSTSPRALREMTSVQQALSLRSNWNFTAYICCKHLREMAYETPAALKACAMRI